MAPRPPYLAQPAPRFVGPDIRGIEPGGTAGSDIRSPNSVPGAAYGQQHTVKFGDSPLTIVQADRASPDSIVHTFAVCIQKNSPTPGGVTPDDTLADVPVVIQIDVGVGGYMQTVEFSAKNGTIVSLPAQSWNVRAFIEQGITPIQKGKTVRVGVSVGVYPHGVAGDVSRDYSAAFPVNANVTYDIPRYAQEIAIVSNGPAADFSFDVVGQSGVVLYTQAAPELGKKYPLPASAARVVVKHAGAAPANAVTMFFLRLLLG
jgi:hypothetical protein